jgi:hypothetical protein
MAYVDLRDAAIAESVESIRCSHPDIALSIFKDRSGLTAGEAVSNQKLILLYLSVGLLW